MSHKNVKESKPVESENTEAPKKVPTNASILRDIFKKGVKDKDEAKALLIKAQLKAQKKATLAECVNSKGKPITEEHLAQQVTGFLRNLKYKETAGDIFYKSNVYDKDTWFVVEDEKGIRLEQRVPISEKVDA